MLGASSEPLLVPQERTARLVAVPEDGEHHAPIPSAVEVKPDAERRHPRPHAMHGPRFLSLSPRLALLVGLVSVLGIVAGILGIILGQSQDLLGLVAIVALVGIGQALALEFDEGTISVAAVGAIAGAALFGPRAALAIAVTTSVVEWSARRSALHNVLFNIGALTFASLGAAGVFSIANDVSGHWHDLAIALLGLAAGAVYFAVNMALLSLAVAMEGHERWWAVFKERFAWLMPHYVVYGFVGAVMGIAYEAAGLYALAVFAVPLLLMRKTQDAYLAHTQKSAQKLRQAAETIQTQNVSLEQANRLLKERSTAAMESLSATVDARDAYTAGHSRRVQQLALAIGRELGLSQAELDLLGHAALFHDIGKLAIPDAILLKPASLTQEEWALMQRHADEGARIIDRLGFLNDAVPAIRHHHERFDGTGYPDGLSGEDIPLGARIIHVADALDSMLTTRIYRAARPAPEALAELRRAAGTQFCPRCVGALERILPVESLPRDDQPRQGLIAAASSARPRERSPGAGESRSPVLAFRASRSILFGMAKKPFRAVAEIDSRGPRRIPGGDPEALHGRPDPGRAGRGRTAAGPHADDARVRGRSGDRRAPADGDRALRQLEQRDPRRRARAATLRHARPSWCDSSATSATSSAGCRRRRTSTRTAPRCRRSRSTGTRSARSRRRCARPASTCRWGRSGSSGPSRRGWRWHARSGGCRSSPTGPRRAAPIRACSPSGRSTGCSRPAAAPGRRSSTSSRSASAPRASRPARTVR